MFGGGFLFVLALAGGTIWSKPPLRDALIELAKQKTHLAKSYGQKGIAKVKEDFDKAGTVPAGEGADNPIANLIIPKFAQLPKDLPEDVPVFQPSTVNLSSVKDVSEGKKSYTIIMTAGGVDPDTVAKFYTEKMREQGWVMDEALGLSGRVAVVGKKPDAILNISILDTSGSSQLTINYTPRVVVQQ